ncbi:MAG: TolC family protein [Verrucomicrobia bacterium]|nr:TolC family protein [Verrucomicrobiota bacterium]
MSAIAVGLCLSVVAVATEHDARDEHPTLSDYLADAALHNPGLEAAFNRWKAALERIPQMNALPDPKLTYAYFIETVETRVGPQRQRIGVTQRFPWFGTLGLRGDVAGEAAAAAYQAYEATKLKLFYAVKHAYYEYYYLARSIAITEDNIHLLKHLEGVAQARYKAGAPIAGVIKAQVELGKLDDRRRTLMSMREPMAARLNAALGRSVDRELPWPREAPRQMVDFTDDAILADFRASSPSLLGLDHEVLKEEKALRLARKAGYPAFMLGVDYIETGEALNPSTVDSGKDPLVGMVGIDIPIWRDKLRAGVREAQYRVESATQTRMDQELVQAADIKMALFGFRDAERKINLYGSTLIPQTEQALHVAEEAYRAGHVDFMSLIDAERLLLEFQLAHVRAQVDREQQLALIEMLVGKSFAGPTAPEAARLESQP